MNSSEVSKLLGVSVSTIQRWVKQLELPMERNDRGHYLFKDEDVGALKQIHKKIQEGVLLQDLAPQSEKKIRKGTAKTDAPAPDKSIEMLLAKMNEFEAKLNDKADSVTSYQLLQHRREIEDLQSHVQTLMNKMSLLESNLEASSSVVENQPASEQTMKKKPKKKNLVTTLFGFLANS